MRSYLRVTFLAITVIIIVTMAGIWGIGSLLSRTTNSPVPLPPYPGRLVQFASDPGIRLAGTYWPAASAEAPAVLLLHGNGSNRASMTKTAILLNQNGFAVLAIDFRGHGQSSPASKSFGLFEANDAWAAYRWLRRSVPDRKIGIIGFSLGGAASLIGRQGPIPVDALMLEGVYPDIRHAIFNRLAFRIGRLPARILEPLLSYQSRPRLGAWPAQLSPLNALIQVREPVMIVGGGDDTNTPPSETQAMYDAVRSHKLLQILPGVGHDELGREQTAGFEVKLLNFLNGELKSKRLGR